MFFMVELMVMDMVIKMWDSEITRIGEYMVGWHEGNLAIMPLDDYISKGEFKETAEYNGGTVNSAYEASEAVDYFEYECNLMISDVERHDIITFACLSSIFQDMVKPFKWEDILIFRGCR